MSLRIIFIFLLSLSLHAESSATDRYLGYTGELLEQKYLGDEHLLAMMAGAEKGKAVNPIFENEAKTSITHQVAKQTFAHILKDPIDVKAIIPWATAKLSQEAREREEKKRKQEETKLPWKIQKHAQLLAAGYSHTCAVKTDKTVQCWGNNGSGQSSVPSDLGPVQSVSAGFLHICAVKADKTVQCWGDNDYGQLSVPADLGPVQSISAGSNHTCAVKADGTVQCWCKNDQGQLNVPEGLIVALD